MDDPERPNRSAVSRSSTWGIGANVHRALLTLAYPRRVTVEERQYGSSSDVSRDSDSEYEDSESAIEEEPRPEEDPLAEDRGTVATTGAHSTTRVLEGSSTKEGVSSDVAPPTLDIGNTDAAVTAGAGASTSNQPMMDKLDQLFAMMATMSASVQQQQIGRAHV